MRVVTIVMLSSGIPILSCVPADIGSVGVREVGISCPLLSALLACFSTTCFTPRFALRVATDPSVFVARKSRSRTELLANTSPQIKKKQLLKNNITYSATFTVKHTAASPGTVSYVHWFDVNVSVNHTYQEPPPQV